MIKKLFTLGLALAAFAGTAQTFKASLKSKKHSNTSSLRTMHTNAVASASDSLMVTPCNDATDPNVTLYGGFPVDYDNVVDSGYFFGTGYYPLGSGQYIYFTESAQKYTVSGPAHITDVIFLAGSAYSSAATSTIVSNVYSMDATTNAPGTLLGTSASMALQTVSTANFNDMMFSTPVAVNNQSFFVSVTAPLWQDATHDTLSIAVSDIGTCPAVGDSTAWMYAAAYIGTTHAAQFDQWGSAENFLFGGQANADLAIYPVIDVTTGISKVTKGGMSLFAASPNPTNSNININFSLEKPSSISVEVYDISGKIVKTVKNNNAVAGKNAISIDVTNLEAGSYMYSINANGNKMFSKFVVTK